MSFWKFWRKRSEKGSINQRLLPMDLLSHLSYMSAIATAGVSREVIFREASQLPYVSSRYFNEIYTLCNRLNYDYANACRLVGETAEEGEVKSLLLRLSGSLAAGEPEKDFLNREASVQAESYGDQYERQLESTKKWTDSYTALIVSAALIIIVAVISMMIYQVGVVFVIVLALLTVLVTVAGSWIIDRSAPNEIKTHSLLERSPNQYKARMLFKILGPTAVILVVVSLAMGVGLAWTLLLGAALFLPVGFFSVRDDREIDKKDADIAPFLRALGGVTEATGTTIAEALSRIDVRSTGSLAPEVRKLRIRLQSGFEPALCWRRFVADTGSELVDRTIKVFCDGIPKGATLRRWALVPLSSR